MTENCCEISLLAIREKAHFTLPWAILEFQKLDTFGMCYRKLRNIDGSRRKCSSFPKWHCHKKTRMACNAISVCQMCLYQRMFDQTAAPGSSQELAHMSVYCIGYQHGKGHWGSKMAGYYKASRILLFKDRHTLETTAQPRLQNDALENIFWSIHWFHFFSKHSQDRGGLYCSSSFSFLRSFHAVLHDGPIDLCFQQ